MGTNTIQKISDKQNKFIIRYAVIMCYSLQPIFILSWRFFSSEISIRMTKANGDPFEDIGMLLAILPALITVLGVMAIYKKIILQYLKHNNLH